ncbi:MAG: SDR family NAD(P)-dependent oxidoreductase [Proteobacteria bacterium]|nr:MAG: SDR family NAD(P)-dependent oxidoreductase [Pseudomonadota bacterium]
MERSGHLKNQRILVTGATGFLGSWTVERLLREGATVFATGRSRRYASELETKGAQFLSVDLAETSSIPKLKEFCSGHLDAVVHSGALSSVWGKYEDFYSANVLATRNLVELASRLHSSPKFIHISSPSIYIQNRDRHDIRESEPIPSEFINHYAKTKFLSEIEIKVAQAKGIPALVLRPQGLFGPRDTSVFPRILKVGRRGFFPHFDGRNHLVDVTYVENVVEAIVCALKLPVDRFRGQAYNITNGEPIAQEVMVEKLLIALDIPFRFKTIPFQRAWLAATVLEKFHRVFMPMREPVLTRYAVNVLGFDRTLNIDLARQELGYQPVVTMADGFERTLQWFRESNT